MGLSSTLFTLLSGDSNITDIVGDKIYPNNLPQTTTRPCIEYDIISRVPNNVKGSNGVSRMDDYRVYITLYSDSKAQVEELALKVRNLLDYMNENEVSGTYIHWVYFNNEFDNFDITMGQRGTYKIIQDYKFSIRQ